MIVHSGVEPTAAHTQPINKQTIFTAGKSHRLMIHAQMIWQFISWLYKTHVSPPIKIENYAQLRQFVATKRGCSCKGWGACTQCEPTVRDWDRFGG